MSLISLTEPLSTTKWMMYENGMNPGVHLLGLYFKISDEHTLPHIFFGGSITPPHYYPRNEESDLFD